MFRSYKFSRWESYTYIRQCEKLEYFLLKLLQKRRLTPLFATDSPCLPLLSATNAPESPGNMKTTVLPAWRVFIPSKSYVKVRECSYAPSNPDVRAHTRDRIFFVERRFELYSFTLIDASSLSKITILPFGQKESAKYGYRKTTWKHASLYDTS